MRLLLAQLNFTVGAFDDNFTKMAAAVEHARAHGADLVVFSELATTGYPPRDLLRHERFIDLNLEQLDRLAALSADRPAILTGFVDRNPRATGKRLYNAAALCSGGRIVARRAKSLLPTYDVFDEDRYFEPATTVEPIVFKGARLGVTICEDVWNDRDFWPSRLYHRDPVEELADQHVDLFINISASPFTADKPDLRRRMIAQEAVTHRRCFLYVNQVGGNDELIFDGHSIGIGPDGRELLRGRSFEEDLILCDVPAGDDTPLPPAVPPLESGEIEDVYAALVLGLRDYVRKSGLSSAVLGLSGGIDSAVVACLAADALGADRVLGVALPSRYSSAHSVADAEALARNLGIGYRLVSIDGIYQAQLDALAPLFEGREPDATEENLQARARGALLMALSNKFGAILLTTGNKSELAVGYCTLYGDMAGGLAVISDVPKTLVYRLAAWINRDREIIPASTMTKPPSAELRPGQLDTDSLPPYEVLDPIVQAYVEEHLSADEIVARGFDPAVVADVLRRIDSNEYKRRQAAPGLKISPTAFGIGRRYPLAADYRALRRTTARR
ncbi:MAG: NAD+ synthase [Acidobacteriota bacterium]|jgi:NAD+ synthase (glutamine-hydrolysing)|nr:MAG: NAD+ synthase [Acidobacteriota bacterium]